MKLVKCEFTFKFDTYLYAECDDPTYPDCWQIYAYGDTDGGMWFSGCNHEQDDPIHLNDNLLTDYPISDYPTAESAVYAYVQTHSQFDLDADACNDYLRTKQNK